MGRRQQQVPPAPAGSALAAAATEGSRGRGQAKSKSGAGPDSGSADFIGAMDGGAAGVTAAGGLASGAGAGGGTEEAERAFWELVFSRHERLHPLLDDLRLASAARARQLARVHCVRLFTDLVYAGLSPRDSVVGFHLTPVLQDFLDALLASHVALTSQGVEAFVQQVRPDFARYLNPPGE
jgi:hypothetical protein